MLYHRHIFTRQLALRPSSTFTSTSFSSSRTIFHRMSSTSSSSTSPQPSSNADEQPQQQLELEAELHKPVLTLPAPGDAPQGNINQLEVNGKDIKLDILGPVVVNENGTMSRIDNWAEMAEIEKANVRRILLKRNAQRLARLRSEAGITTAREGDGA